MGHARHAFDAKLNVPESCKKIYAVKACTGFAFDREREEETPYFPRPRRRSNAENRLPGPATLEIWLGCLMFLVVVPMACHFF